MLSNVSIYASFRYNPEESLLPGALVSLVYWLLQILALVLKHYEMNAEISAGK